MKFSEHWLRTLVDPPIDSGRARPRLDDGRARSREIASGRAAVHRRGRRQGARRSSVIPNADRLTVCRVDAGPGDAVVDRLRRAQRRAGPDRAVRAASARRCPAELRIRQGGDARRRVAGHALLGERARPLRRRVGLACCSTRRSRSAPICASALDLDDAVLDAQAHAESRRLPVDRRLWRARSRRSPRHRVPCRRLPSAQHARKLTRGVRVEDPLACPRFCGRVIEGIDATARHAGVDEAAHRAQRHPLDLGRRRRHQLRDARTRAAAARVRRRACSMAISSFASRKPGETLTLLNGQTARARSRPAARRRREEAAGSCRHHGRRAQRHQRRHHDASSSKARSGIPPSSRARRAASVLPPTQAFGSSAVSTSQLGPRRSTARRS